MEIAELKYAAESIHKMETASSLDDYERHWKDLLVYLATFWTKCQEHGKLGEIPQRVISTVNHDRKGPLLKYLARARDCHVHTIRPVVKRTGGHTTITAGPGGARIAGGKFSGNGEFSANYSGDLQVKFHPAEIELIDVQNRDQDSACTPVPTSHLGQPLTTRRPHELAKIALDYYANAIKSIE